MNKDYSQRSESCKDIYQKQSDALSQFKLKQTTHTFKINRLNSKNK